MFVTYMPIVLMLSFLSLHLGMSVALKMRDHQHLLLGFGAGSMVGVAIYALLPEALDNYQCFSDQKQNVAWLVALGFVVYMLLERFFLAHFHREDGCQSERHDGRFGAAAILLHGAIDGFAMMMSFRAGVAIGWSVTIALVVHQFADAMNITTMVMRGTDRGTFEGRQLSQKRQWSVSLWILGMFLAVVGGMLSGFWWSTSWSELRPIFAVLAGLFLYVGAADLIPESHHAHPTIWTTLATVAGMAVIYGVVSIGGG